MMLIVLDRDPVKAVHTLIVSTLKKFWTKQLIELGQLICSAGISNQFKPIPRGKQIQEWIKQFPGWTLEYYKTLYTQCKQIVHYQPETLVKLDTIQSDLAEYCTTLNILSLIILYLDFHVAMNAVMKQINPCQLMNVFMHIKSI